MFMKSKNKAQSKENSKIIRNSNRYTKIEFGLSLMTLESNL
jgi:hypothetical protein